jgi:hypothetical protein
MPKHLIPVELLFTNFASIAKQCRAQFLLYTLLQSSRVTEVISKQCFMGLLNSEETKIKH